MVTRYNPSGAVWDFNSSSGIVGVSDAPQGIQVGFIENFGVISQTLTGFVPGSNYTLSFEMAQRPGQATPENFDVEMNFQVIASIASTITNYVLEKIPLRQRLRPNP